MITRKPAGALIAVVLALFPLTACTGGQSSPESVETPAPQETSAQQEPPLVTPDSQVEGSNAGPLQQPAGPPPVEAAPSPVDVPDPNSVSGGGPLNSDKEAAARINQQLPEVPELYQLTGAEALEYANNISAVIPGLAPTFKWVVTVANCGTDYGVVAAKAFIDRNYKAAGVMVVLSRNQLQQLPRIALSCFKDSVTGGGPSEDSGYRPCIRQYYYDRNMNGVVDRYFVIVGATQENYCTYLEGAHSNFNPQSFSV